MRHFWISWHQPTQDHRPLTYPPRSQILGWWCTGVRCSDYASTMCAQVKADSEAAAKGAILKDWPEAAEWRFCNETDASPPESYRFPLSEWMRPRFDAAA